MADSLKEPMHEQMQPFTPLAVCDQEGRECGVRGDGEKDRQFRRYRRPITVLLFVCMSMMCLSAWTCDDSQPWVAIIMIGMAGSGRTYYNPGVVRRNAQAANLPLISGTDGSQTGTASFEGNFTTISAFSAGGFMIARQTDCSLTRFSVDNSTQTSATIIPQYELYLHQLGQLSTKADVFAKGCIDPNRGTGSRPAIWVGRTTSGVLVFAAAFSSSAGTYIDIDTSANSFTRSRVTTTPYASALATTDLNGDKNNDLVVVNGAGAPSSSITVLLGNADGSFRAPVSYPTGGNYTVAADIDDVNGDGKADIVTISADQQFSVLLGNGDGTFQSAQSFAAPVLPGYTSTASTPIVGLITADVNGDGNKDVICSNGLVLLGKGDGTFTATALPAFPNVLGTSAEGPNLAAGDLNNDGKLDLVLNTGNTISTWIGNGDGTFKAGHSYGTINDTGFVTVTDLDGDGNADIFVGEANGGMFTADDSTNTLSYFLMGNGDGTFQGAPALSSGAYTGNNLVDLNGDGVPDLVTLSNSGVLTVQLNNSKGAFTAGANIAPQTSFSLNGFNFTMTSSAKASSFAVADVNGDNKPDVVFVDNGLTAINPGSGFPISYPYPVYFVALGNGDGTFQTAVPYAFPQIAAATGFDNTAAASSLNIADFTHDGKADLLFVYNETGGGTGVNFYNQGIVVLPGNGNGTFGAPKLTSTYSSNTAPTTAFVSQVLNVLDLTGDNNPDLVVNVPGTTIINFQLQTQLETFVSNGDGTFKTPTTVSVGANTYTTALADFNKDGKTDLAVLAETSGSQAELVVLPGNGNGTFGTAAVSNLAGGDAIRSAGLAAADFDGDGNPDLALLDGNDFSGVFYGKGNGTFTSVPLSGGIIPKDLINIEAGAPAVAIDLNKDGKPDILTGGVSLLNITGSTPVLTAATTTALVTAQSPIVVGTSVKFTATVAGVSGSTGTPTGTVTFMDGTTSLGTGTLAAGAATYTTSALTGASHSITAVYGGDANFSGSTSNVVTEVVNKATPTVTVTPAPTSITSAQALTVTVAVAGTAGNSTPTGSVVLSGGGYTSAATTLVSGSAAINIAAGALATGTDTLTANYTPDSGSSSSYVMASGSNTVTVTTAPSFALSNGGNISFAAAATTGNTASVTVTPSNGFTGTVNLSCAVTTIPAGATSPATCGVTSSVNVAGTTAQTATLTVTTTSATTTGAYAVTVTGSSGSLTKTTVVGVTVTAFVLPPSFTLSNGGNISIAAAATTGNTSTINVSPSGGFTGTVNLTCAVTTIPSGAVSPATCGVTSSVNVASASPVAATVTVTTTSTTTIGAYSVTVTGVSGALTQTTVVGVTVTAFVPPASFALTNGGAITVTRGATTGNTSTITVTPSGGFTGSVALTAALTANPSGAVNLPTFSFGATTPVSITGATAGTGTLTVSTTGATSAAMERPRLPGVPWYAAGGATLACLLLFGIPARRRWRTLLGMVMLLAVLIGGVVSCGGKAKTINTGSPGTTAGSYTITVTGTSGALSQTTTVNLTVN